MTMRQVLAKMKNDRDFELVIQWNSSPQANLKALEQIEFEQINLSSSAKGPALNSGRGGTSIYDCINWFS